MKYLNFDSNGKILGFYDDEIHLNIPKPNAKITDEVWQEALKSGANFYDQKSGALSFKDFRSEDEILQELKKQMITLIHEKKDELNYSNYEFENHTYRMGADVQADLLATITIFGAVGKLPDGYTIKDIKSGEYVAFDLPKLVKLSAEVATRKATAIFKTQKLEDVINSCNSKEELEKINLNSVKE